MVFLEFLYISGPQNCRWIFFIIFLDPCEDVSSRHQIRVLNDSEQSFATKVFKAPVTLCKR